MTQYTAPDRAYALQAVQAIDPQSYEITRDAEGVAHTLQLDEETGDRLEATVRNSVKVKDGRLDAVDVTPGGVRVVVEPSPGRSSIDLSPLAVERAVREATSSYNEQYATPEAGSDGYLDGIEDGPRYVEAVRPSDAPAPEEWLADHVDRDAYPDSDGAVVTVEAEDPPERADTPESPNLPLIGLWKIDAETYGPVSSSSRFNSATTSFEWDGAIEAQFREFVHSFGFTGPGWRVSVFPTHIRVALDSGSRSAHPSRPVFGPLETVVEHFNRKRGDLSDDGEPEQRRPKLQLTDERYIGVRDPDGRAAEWIEARGLDDVTGDPVDPEADADDEEEDPYSGGLLSRLRRSTGQSS